MCIVELGRWDALVMCLGEISVICLEEETRI